MTSAARMRELRARQANGKVVLRIECDETELSEILVAARLIDRNAEPSRAALEQALERLIVALGREQ